MKDLLGKISYPLALLFAALAAFNYLVILKPDVWGFRTPMANENWSGSAAALGGIAVVFGLLGNWLYKTEAQTPPPSTGNTINANKAKVGGDIVGGDQTITNNYSSNGGTTVHNHGNVDKQFNNTTINGDINL